MPRATIDDKAQRPLGVPAVGQSLPEVEVRDVLAAIDEGILSDKGLRQLSSLDERGNPLVSGSNAARTIIDLPRTQFEVVLQELDVEHLNWFS